MAYLALQVPAPRPVNGSGDDLANVVDSPEELVPLQRIHSQLHTSPRLTDCLRDFVSVLSRSAEHLQMDLRFRLLDLSAQAARPREHRVSLDIRVSQHSAACKQDVVDKSPPCLDVHCDNFGGPGRSGPVPQSTGDDVFDGTSDAGDVRPSDVVLIPLYSEGRRRAPAELLQPMQRASSVYK